MLSRPLTYNVIEKWQDCMSGGPLSNLGHDLSIRDEGLGLVLADGNEWLFVGEDASASATISKLKIIDRKSVV